MEIRTRIFNRINDRHRLPHSTSQLQSGRSRSGSFINTVFGSCFSFQRVLTAQSILKIVCQQLPRFGKGDFGQKTLFIHERQFAHLCSIFLYNVHLFRKRNFLSCFAQICRRN